ncbi:hypothetical protein ACUNWD_00605 [Sunxiuqinia sp. A32]|uniref:hypothetical protein n=1 Tax=Sunxiuqinia sp. A32 TaxID=3461496 RepID=UPI004045D1D2
MKSFGDRLFKSISDSRSLLFLQGEMAQLTFIAYEKFIELVNEEKAEKIPITYPVGYRADNTPINSTRDFTKDELINRYKHLSLIKLPVDGIYQLVTIMDTLQNEIFRNILMEFPNKISNKRKVDVEVALGAKSLEEIKISIVNNILNELAYKSPKDYSEEFNKYVGVNLLEHPPFHKYIELKATRDIHIHNSGIANEIYLTKAATLARVKNGEFLPVDIQYFLQTYEACLQLTEILELELDKIWVSEDYRAYKKSLGTKDEKTETVEKVIAETQEIVHDEEQKNE